MDRQLRHFRLLGLNLDLQGEVDPSRLSRFVGGFLFLCCLLHNLIACAGLYSLFQALSLENINSLGYLMVMLLAQTNIVLVLVARNDIRSLVAFIRDDRRQQNRIAYQRSQPIADKYRKYLNLSAKFYEYYSIVAFVVYFFVQIIRFGFTGHLNLFVDIYYGEMIGNRWMYLLIVFLNVQVSFFAMIVFPLSDMFNFALILHPACELEILADALVHLKGDALQTRRETTGRNIDHANLTKIMKNKLLDCIKLHQRIVK